MPVITEDIQSGGSFSVTDGTSVAHETSSTDTDDQDYLHPLAATRITLYESDKSTPQAVLASLTVGGRELLARMATEGLGIKIVGFRVGRGGYSPSSPTQVVAIDDTATALIDPIFPAPSAPVEPIDRFEAPNDTGMSYLCRLASTEAIAAIGEWGIYAEIVTSPNDSTEVGDQYLFAVVHRPMFGKTLQDVAVWRLVIQYGTS